MYDQGDIVLIPFPYSDLSGAKQRPALIISNKKVNRSEDRICCLITSNPSSDGIKIEKSYYAGGALPFQSWIKPHRLFTIHAGIVRKKLCSLNRKSQTIVSDEVSALIDVS